ASESIKKTGFDPSESGGDPSVKSTTDPSDINPSCPDASQPDEQGSADEFLSRHPEAVVYSAAKRQWGSQDDLTCAEFIWGKIISMYELAAESDGEVVRPKEPNWTAWANEVRLMVMQDGRTHKQICSLFKRANKDSFWCKNVLSPSKLREKWDELSLKLSAPLNSSRQEASISRASFDGVDYSLPENSGFRT
ncbi:TPA: helix-turn-helix domain-containing protein, partial [Klebsiella pneumoniae]